MLTTIIIDDVLISSSNESFGRIVDDFDQSRTYKFERLDGRMPLVSGMIKTLGIATSTAFKIKHSKLLSKI